MSAEFAEHVFQVRLQASPTDSDAVNVIEQFKLKIPERAISVTIYPHWWRGEILLLCRADDETSDEAVVIQYTQLSSAPIAVDIHAFDGSEWYISQYSNDQMVKLLRRGVPDEALVLPDEESAELTKTTSRLSRRWSRLDGQDRDSSSRKSCSTM